jgi:pimeloyl-ACP methyl ester carboxylesterase
MNRRGFLSGAVSITLGGVLSSRAWGAQLATFRVQGSGGPTVLALERFPKGYYDRLAERYRVVVIDYPPKDDSPAFAESFTPDKVCSDIMAVADSVGADRFAWYGFSWGGVVGLQLAGRTDRLSALICGGWPPLGAPYRDMPKAARDGKHITTFYTHLVDWPERDAVAKIRCPRMTFAGSKDVIVTPEVTARIGPLISEHRAELQRMGWVVHLVDGIDHSLGGRPDIVTPIVREFLDPILL